MSCSQFGIQMFTLLRKGCLSLRTVHPRLHACFSIPARSPDAASGYALTPPPHRWICAGDQQIALLPLIFQPERRHGVSHILMSIGDGPTRRLGWFDPTLYTVGGGMWCE